MFSNETIVSITKTLASFPKIEDIKKRPVIRFSHTIDNISLHNLDTLLRVCNDKTVIDIEGANLE